MTNTILISTYIPTLGHPPSSVSRNMDWTPWPDVVLAGVAFSQQQSAQEPLYTSLAASPAFCKSPEGTRETIYDRRPTSADIYFSNADANARMGTGVAYSRI